jgi:hypothetical protein
MVLGPRLPIYELPDHVGGIGLAVDLRHQVFPLEAVAMIPVVVGAMPVLVVIARMTLVRFRCVRRMTDRDIARP